MSAILLDPQWFIDEDFRFRLGTVPGSAEDFFALSSEASPVLAERREWLTADPQRYATILPAGNPIAEELLNVTSQWQALENAPAKMRSSEVSLFDRFLTLSKCLEPDLVLLAPSSDEQFTVVGGSVCFPSSWRLTDKLGQSVAEVHEPVPQLNTELSVPIDRLLSRLRPGKCVVRANWGVCALPELNQHPDRNLPGIQLPVSLDQIWLRREDQCLFTLPETRGVIFGIRVTHHSWRDIRQVPQAARSVARALRSMPRDMLDYKRLTEVCEQLAQMLDASGTGDS